MGQEELASLHLAPPLNQLQLSEQAAARLQAAYGCSILSFLGGVHWGAAMAGGGASFAANAGRYAWGVTPSLLAWPAMAVLDGPEASASLAAGLSAALMVDLRFGRAGLLPGWYVNALRIPLTAAALASLALTATAPPSGVLAEWKAWASSVSKQVRAAQSSLLPEDLRISVSDGLTSLKDLAKK